MSVLFIPRSLKKFKALEAQVEEIRERPTAIKFYTLAGLMQAYRDFIYKNLLPLGEDERREVEGKLPPGISAMTDKACRLAEEAEKAGIIPNWGVWEIVELSNGLNFYSNQTLYVI